MTVPMSQNKLNRLLIIGTIMGQVGFVTWNGYDADHKGENNESSKTNVLVTVNVYLQII